MTTLEFLSSKLLLPSQVELGAAVWLEQSEEFGATTPPAKVLIEIAKKWIEEHWGAVTNIVCENQSEIRARLQSPEATLLAIITDVLTNSTVAFGLPAAQVAQLMCLVGVEKLCRDCA